MDDEKRKDAASNWLAVVQDTSSYGVWRMDGPFLVDGRGRQVAVMQGEPADYAAIQRRLIAAANALRDTPTQYIEELLEQSDSNIIMTLIERNAQMRETLQRLQENIDIHRREIVQLHDVMEACRAFEAQRASLKQAPGFKEYENLLRVLGLR
jgi:hypothetical protein